MRQATSRVSVSNLLLGRAALASRNFVAPSHVPTPNNKLGKKAQIGVFEKALNGIALKQLATEYNVTIQTIHNVFWRGIVRLQYYDGSITSDCYYNCLCGNNIVRASCDIKNIRDNQEHYIKLYDAMRTHVLTLDSSLLHISICTKSLRQLNDNGINTVGDYVASKDTVRRLKGIGQKTLAALNTATLTIKLDNRQLL